MKKILLNVILSLGVLEIVFAVLDWFNPYMNFQSNSYGKVISVVFAAAGVILAVTEFAGAQKKPETAKVNDKEI